MQSCDGDTTASPDADSLICGFGPRNRKPSVDSTDAMFDHLSDNVLNGATNTSLICGFGGDEKSMGSSAGPPQVSDYLRRLDGESQQQGYTTTSVPTKGLHDDDADGEKARPRRKMPRRASSGRSMDDSRSISSDGESMASEDAVVLMIKMMEEIDGSEEASASTGTATGAGGDEKKEREAGEGGRRRSERKKYRSNRRRSADNGEVCGRVFKGQRLTDYGSIPTMLQIETEGGSSDPVGAAMQGMPIPVPKRKHANNVPDGGMAPSSQVPPPRPKFKPSSLEEKPTAKSPPRHPGSREPPQAASKHVSIDNNTTYMGENGREGNGNYEKGGEKLNGQPRRGSTGAEPNNGPSSSVIFHPSSEQAQQRRRSTGTAQSNGAVGFQPSSAFQQRRRSSDGAADPSGLQVIAEDDHDSSTATTDLKASFKSHGTAGTGSSSTAASDASTTSSNVMDVIGEHAKSMARQLHMEGIVDSSSKSRHRKAKSKKKRKEEGRQAIIGRISEREYVKVAVPKPESVQKLIHDAISKNILFKACSGEELTELVEVFAPSEASAGSTIIRQGDEGDAFYVLERGTIDVYEGDTHKATLYSGSSFGEIALLYGCPRSATLRTRYFCKLWSISRSAFRAITSQFKQRRMEAKAEFLKKVKIKDKLLSDVLSETELSTLALATINESYSAGHTIVREGEPGDIFYMIDSGCVDVFIKAKGDAPVVTLRSGAFFGELALLSNDNRTASCVAKTDVECHILMRDDFNLLLGDLQSLMDGGDYRRREEEFVQPRKSSKASLQVNLEDLDILKVLGIGAFGRVRLAKLKKPVKNFDNNDGYFALKCIAKQSLKDNGLESHILNEKAIMSGLEHPFINRYYCDMEDDKYLYFLLEALPGGELCKRLREEKQFPEPWGRFYSASVLFAFCHMHAKKIAYRDLKPENLVMDSVGYVKVVDFGLAKVIKGGKTWTLCGTPAYLAPEIVLNDGHDWAVDYWALGVFLFEMTSGKEPFAAKNPMEVYKQIVSGHVEIPSYFSRPLTDLIRKLLNTSKSKRLGRTMGGGGAVMAQAWYSDFDWDAHLEKKLEAPLEPKTQEILREDSVTSDSRDSTAVSKRPSKKPERSLAKQKSSKSVGQSAKPPRLTYSLGQGNRHHQKMLEMMDNSCGEHVDPGQNVDTVRMTMMRVIKQHERWSRSSRDSMNSSTRNTALGVGTKMSTRSSVNTDSGSTVASSAMHENLDAFLRLQLMHLSLASKKDSQERDAFQQFSLLSISPSSLSENSEVGDSCGGRFLDPFTFRKIDLVDQFPRGNSESDIDAEALAAFCFPNGLRARLIPRSAEEGAKRLGWFGGKGDSYQLQGFTDVAGSLSHGCAITIREELVGDDAAKVSSVIQFHRQRRRSAVVIARWWRKQFRQPQRSKSGPIFGSRPVAARRANSMKWGRRSTHEERNSAVGIRGAMDKVMSMSRSRNFKSASMGDIAFDDDERDPYDEESWDSGKDEASLHEPQPEHIRRLGISAYQAMIEADEAGYICVVDKSYVLTGTKLQDQSLFFCALQNLVDMERKYSFNPENRQAVLSALQSKLSLTPLQRRVAYPRNEMAHITRPQRRFVMDLSIMGFSKISLPLPLPEVSGQWGLSTLFLRIKDSGLIILLKLLLLERSVLVVGETPEEVTACTTALLELLEPYKWASAFMPLLPRDMLDFVSSPVPFIAGMVVEGKKHLHSIIHDHGVKDAMLHGLSIVNLVSGKLIVTREQGTSDMLRRSFQTIPELAFYQKRLEEYCKSSSSNLRSFQSFFRNGASLKESLTLRKIKKVIKNHMSQFTMGLSDKPDAWQQYGEFNEASGTFDFCPDKFIQPLKDRMIFQIQFQEMMAHTQLFVGYVEEIQLAHEKRSNLLSGPAAKFIAHWCELHWHAKYS